MTDYQDADGFGTPPWMLRRNTDPITSHIAAEANDSQFGERQVFEAIRSFGEKGCISDDLMDYFGFEDQRDAAVSYSGITGRYIALERSFHIERTGATRVGHRFKRQQLVMRALSDEERIRRQEASDRAVAEAITDANLALLIAWSVEDEKLKVQQEVTELAKQAVLDAMFPDVLTGRYSIELYQGYELIVTFMRRGTRLEIELMSDGRKRNLERARMESQLAATQLTDAETVQWKDEHP